MLRPKGGGGCKGGTGRSVSENELSSKKLNFDRRIMDEPHLIVAGRQKTGKEKGKWYLEPVPGSTLSKIHLPNLEKGVKLQKLKRVPCMHQSSLRSKEPEEPSGEKKRDRISQSVEKKTDYHVLTRPLGKTMEKGQG